MKINWHPNPFYTKVEIDDRDRERVLLYLQNEEYVEILCGLDNALNGKYRGPALTDLEEIKKEVGKWGDICDMTINSEEVMTFLSYIDTVHLGDCTCVPCSCIRCQVEEALGIDTIKGLGKHSARKIEGAFGKDGNKTIDEAIATLERRPDYTKPETWPDSVGWDVHIPRWEKEREAALVWLKKYKEEHGF